MSSLIVLLLCGIVAQGVPVRGGLKQADCAVSKTLKAPVLTTATHYAPFVVPSHPAYEFEPPTPSFAAFHYETRTPISPSRSKYPGRAPPALFRHDVISA
ncbi:hypothetical protein GSVR_32360 [Geobacter sp. SVR]|nr:hypothetical protein GSVR_32360 [Geobacter sp. SVR]